MHEGIKLFGMSHQMLERDLDRVEATLSLDLGRGPAQDDRDDVFYPQFDLAVRQEAAAMAAHYELFYCLEKSIRSILAETLAGTHGPNWWDQPGVIPEPVRTEVARNIQREIDQAVAPRSQDEIDYTTFGQLGDIVRANWDLFRDIFNSEKAFNRVMAGLNLLRGPIAHCSPLPPSEIVRLQTTVGDWFRLMS